MSKTTPDEQRGTLRPLGRCEESTAQEQGGDENIEGCPDKAPDQCGEARPVRRILIDKPRKQTGKSDTETTECETGHHENIEACSQQS